MLTLNLATPQEHSKELADRVRVRRLGLNLTQAGLAARAGMSTSSYKRFERTGEIAFVSLLQIAQVLDATQEFHALFPARTQMALDDLLAEKKQRVRGRRQ
jgi:transcriptional regulator with XRE-family HTH domain